jgi:hypothetical protein
MQAPSEQAAEERAAGQQGGGAEASPVSDASLAPPPDGATGPDSLEAMLAQMDETLALIRAARESAA